MKKLLIAGVKDTQIIQRNQHRHRVEYMMQHSLPDLKSAQRAFEARSRRDSLCGLHLVSPNLDSDEVLLSRLMGREYPGTTIWA